MSWLSKAFSNPLQAILDPAGSTVRAITNKGDTSTSTIGQFLDPAGLGAGKFTDAAIGGGQLQGKLNTSSKPAAAAAVPGNGLPSMPLTNPFSQFFYQPGVGYMAQQGGPNPFAGVMSSIPSTFFKNPQAIAALSQILNQTAPAQGTPSTPGPDPSGTTMLNSTGGFGNGGGTMNIATPTKKTGFSPWMRAI